MPSFPTMPTSREAESSTGMISEMKPRDGEKDLVEALVRRVKHVGERELDCFASGQESAQVGFRERREQAIDWRRAFDRWHQYTPRYR